MTAVTERTCASCGEPLRGVPERARLCRPCLARDGVTRRCVDCWHEVLMSPDSPARAVPDSRFRCRRCRGDEESAAMVEFECVACREFSRMPGTLAAKLDFTRGVLCLKCKRASDAERDAHVEARHNAETDDARLGAGRGW